MVSRFVVALLICGVVALLLFAIRSARQPQTRSTVVDVGPYGSRWLRATASAIDALPGHRATLVSDDQLRILWKRLPVSTIAAAVFFFPVGVLALLVCRWDRCWVELSARRTQARVDGVISKAAVDAKACLAGSTGKWRKSCTGAKGRPQEVGVILNVRCQHPNADGGHGAAESA